MLKLETHLKRLMRRFSVKQKMQKPSPKRKVLTQKKGQGKDRVDPQSSEYEAVKRRRMKIKGSGRKRKRETSPSSNVSSSDSTRDSESEDSATKRGEVQI